MIINRQLSEQLYQRVTPLGWVRCYDVAWAVLSLPEMDKALYVEGGVKFIQTERHFMHGWLELDSEIIDPTWYVHDLEYQPRYRIPKDTAIEIWHELGETLPLDPRPHLV
jgi:hypothetical protein